MSKRANKPGENPQCALIPEQAVMEKALEPRKAEPPLRVKVGKRIKISDRDLLRLGKAIGSSDRRFTAGLLGQLAGAALRGGKVEEQSLNFMLSFIEGIEPRDQIESALAAQMAAIHVAMMSLAGQLSGGEALSCFDRLARTFAAQVESLKRYRHGGEQKITVQRVNVGEGGQAIVGNVAQAPREFADRQSSSRPLLPYAQTVEMDPIDQPFARSPQANKPMTRTNRRNIGPMFFHSALRRQNTFRRTLQISCGTG